MTFIDNEPAITAGSISALVAAVIGLAVAFGAPVTAEQKEALLGLVAVVAPLAAVLLTRPHVTPTIKAEEHVAQVLAEHLVAPPHLSP